MIVLGLHFGHDANMALMRDGQLVSYFEKERHCRVRQALGLSSNDIIGFLRAASMDLAQVDVCAITTTQGVPIVDWDNVLQLSGAGLGKVSITKHDHNEFFATLPKDHPYHDRIQWVSGAQYEQVKREYRLGEDFAYEIERGRIDCPLHRSRPLTESDHTQEIAFSIAGRSPRLAFFVSHHLAHAAYAAGFSPFSKALVITFDGMTSKDFAGGGIYLFSDMFCQPVLAHGFWCGTFYDRVAARLGLGGAGRGPGKLMGLAGYGVPCFADSSLTGSITELDGGRFTNGAEAADHWLDRVGEDSNIPPWDGRSYPPAIIANIACSAQSIFNKNVLDVSEKAIALARKLGFALEGICLSGGCALNCPANALLANAYGSIFVPPAVNDEGLSIGAAILFGKDWKRPPTRPLIAYLGNAYPNAKKRRSAVGVLMRGLSVIRGGRQEATAPDNLKRAADAGLVAISEGKQAIRELARRLAEREISGFYHGRAEVGPRALGHRSIVASPLDNELRDRVNRVKSRELWRPLAPACTERKYQTYFSHVPPDSYFMLFNAVAKTKLLPAATHVDGTARVQIVTPACGPFYDLLLAFEEISGHPVLLNTSFNGRGEPIVETPDDAIKTFLRIPLDLLYLDGVLLAKPQQYPHRRKRDDQRRRIDA
jgi:carbamoyltransferase